MGTSGIASNFSIVTLGVTNLARSAEFYRALGWEQCGDQAEGITWFKTSGCWIGLFGYDELADDAQLDAVPAAELPAYRGITLALNFNTEEEVDGALEHAVEVGGTLVKSAHRMDWGGYSGYFADPDGICGRRRARPASSSTRTGGSRSRRASRRGWP